MLTREQFLEVRRQGIGASDVAAIMGLNPFKTAVGVYMEKVGLTPDVPNENMEWGKEFEQIIAARFADKTRLRIEWLGDLTVIGPEPWMFAHPDFKIAHEPHGGEAKMTGGYDKDAWGEEGTDQIPDYYVTQAQWQMLCTGWESVFVTVLFSGRARIQKHYRVWNDPEMAAMMMEGTRDFWEKHVVPQLQPALDWSPASKEYLARRFPSVVEKVREATDEEAALAGEYARVHATFGALEKVKESLANQIKEKIGDYGSVIGEGFKLSWSQYPEVKYEVHKKAGRSLRVSGELFKEAKRVADAGE